MNSSPSPSPASGFTLTELMLVIAIAGVLAVIAIPNLTSLAQSQRVKNASFELFSILSLARSEAIKRNSNVTIAPVISGGTLVSIDVTAAGELLNTIPAPKGVEITASPSAAGGVTYQRSGRTTATGVFFEIDAEDAATPTNYVRCITLELSGIPRTRQGVCS